MPNLRRVTFRGKNGRFIKPPMLKKEVNNLIISSTIKEIDIQLSQDESEESISESIKRVIAGILNKITFCPEKLSIVIPSSHDPIIVDDREFVCW